jgi:enamine deaminase RidA (YjgF/YER057c/UK114 family)
MPKKVVYTDQLMRPIAHFSHAARIGDVVHVGATAGVHPDLRLAGESVGRIDTAAQVRKMFDNLETALGLVGAKLSDVVRIKTYLSFPRDVALYRPSFEERFSALKPSHIVVGSWDFPLPQAAVELDAVAVVGGGKADGARGMTADGLHYATATPVDPQGRTIGAGNIREQTSAALGNLQAALVAAGFGLRDICYLHLTLSDIRDQAEMHTVLEESLGIRLPACTIAGAPLERPDFSIAIEAISAKGGGEVVESRLAPHRAAHFAPAMRHGDFLFLGGQTGLKDGSRPPFDVREQTESAWERLHSLVAAAGFGADTMLRTNNILTDWRDYALFNAGYGKSVAEPYVPRATVLGTLGAAGARVQIEGIAHKQGGDATILQVPPPTAK